MSFTFTACMSEVLLYWMRLCTLMIASRVWKNILVDSSRAAVSVVLFKYMNYRCTDLLSVQGMYAMSSVGLQTVMLPRMMTVMSLALNHLLQTRQNAFTIKNLLYTCLSSINKKPGFRLHTLPPSLSFSVLSPPFNTPILSLLLSI